MTEHNNHNNKGNEIIKNYKEEGAMTLETIEIVNDKNIDDLSKKHHRKGFTLTTPIAIIFAAIIIAGGLMGYGFIMANGGSSNAVPKPLFKGKAIDTSDFVEGKTNAKVFIVEYSDPQCPYCAQLYGTMKQLRTEYESKAAFVYRHFPLTQIHKNAFDESRAIACAGKIGGKEKFYAYIDTLYGYENSKQSTDIPATGKEDFASSIGLDMTAFSLCMKDNQTAQLVNDSITDGIAAGVQGTPSTFILVKTKKGYEQITMIDGARPIDFFKTAIDEALAR